MRVVLVLTSLMLLAASGAGPAAAQGIGTVAVGDFFFCDGSNGGACETVVIAGDAVVWDYAEGTAGHTVTFCGDSCDEPVDSPLFDSGKLLAGETFSFTFGEPGKYLFYCEFHPTAMRGSIVVQPQGTSTPVTPTTTSETGPLPPADDLPTTKLTDRPTSLDAGQETTVPADGDSQTGLIVAAATGAILAVLGVSLFALRRLRG